MGPTTVLYRTQKAEQILVGTGHELSHNQRNALLVVDGKTTVERLEQKAFWVADLVKTLELLLDMGLLSETPPTFAPVPGTETPERTRKNQLNSIANELLGKDAEAIVKKIEETDGSVGALEQALLNCKKIIKLTINEDLAETFLARGRAVIGK